jgi:hypothetical protein
VLLLSKNRSAAQVRSGVGGGEEVENTKRKCLFVQTDFLFLYGEKASDEER